MSDSSRFATYAEFTPCPSEVHDLEGPLRVARGEHALQMVREALVGRHHRARRLRVADEQDAGRPGRARGLREDRAAARRSDAAWRTASRRMTPTTKTDERAAHHALAA